MIEIPLSIVAWFSVVFFQAIVHFGVIGPKRRLNPVDDYTYAEENLTGFDDDTLSSVSTLDTHGDIPSREQENDVQVDDASLSQTGSEIITVSLRNKY